MPYLCREKDVRFLEIAPVKIRNVVEIPASAEAIFKVFEDAQAWTEWFPGIRKVVWTSSKPFGVGTTRTVKVGPLQVWEYFFRWEQNVGFSFYFEKTNLSFVNALVEDYQLEKIDENRTRFIYTVAYEPSPILKLSGPVGRAALKRSFSNAAKSLARYMQNP